MATKASFAALKTRLGLSGTGALRKEQPFFAVEVELSVPSVGLNPSLQAIQDAINAVAKQVCIHIFVDGHSEKYDTLRTNEESDANVQVIMLCCILKQVDHIQRLAESSDPFVRGTRI